MRKRVLFTILFSSLIILNLVSAINLDVSVTPILDSVITDLNEPAIFDLTIRNLGESENFEIYSLVGIDISPEDSFFINSGATKVIRITVNPQEHITPQIRPYTFEYKIKNSKNEVQKEKLTIKIIELKDTILITSENIHPNSDKILISIKNKIAYNFNALTIKIDSAFFNYEDTMGLLKEETKEIELEIDKNKLKNLVAGPYLVNSRIEAKGKKADVEFIIKFLEQEGIETTEVKEGLLIQRQEVTKTNVGNTLKTIKITTKRNLISYLFTTFDQIPETERQGFQIKYTWEKELIPNEEFKLIIKTNWFYPIIIVLFVIIFFILTKRYIESDLMVSKNVSFVKTKGGEFALKVTIKTKAKNFIENIHLIDKIPHLVKLYEKFGAITPDKIDTNNRRLEWNIETLNKGEERIFSYIIYSKIGIIGRFELPSAKAIYEKQGKIKEVESNRSFFINEPGR